MCAMMPCSGTCLALSESSDDAVEARQQQLALLAYLSLRIGLSEVP